MNILSESVKIFRVFLEKTNTKKVTSVDSLLLQETYKWKDDANFFLRNII